MGYGEVAKVKFILKRYVHAHPPLKQRIINEHGFSEDDLDEFYYDGIKEEDAQAALDIYDEKGLLEFLTFLRTKKCG